MKWMHAAVVGCLVIGLVGCGDTGKSTKDTRPDSKTAHTNTGGTPGGDGADKEASNKDKLVGVWEPTAKPGDSLEFKKDGKAIVTMTEKGGKAETMDGTYTVEGDKINITMKGPDGKDHKETATITKLTDTELATKDQQGKTDVFKKKK